MLIQTSPKNIYLFKGNNRNTRKSSKICSKLTMKTPEQRVKKHSCKVGTKTVWGTLITTCYKKLIDS